MPQTVFTDAIALLKNDHRTVEDLFAKTGKVEEMAANAKKMAILDANERIYKIIKDIVG